MNLMERRVTETAAMMMIGDGALGLIRPSYHCLLWRGGARWWRDTVSWFADRPQTTRVFALAELAAGIWLGLRQETAAMGAVGDEVPRTPAVS
jgi:hypothetical protein